MYLSCRSILIIGILLFISKITTFAQAKTNSFVGKPVPALTLQTLDGKDYQLNSLKGKTIVINLFYKNCGFCLQEIPILNEVAEKYKGNENVIFLAISSRDDSVQLRKFIRKNPFSFEIVPSKFRAKGKDWQEETNTKMIYNNFGVKAFPTTIIVDKTGTITFYKIGFSNPDAFKSEFFAALEKAL